MRALWKRSGVLSWLCGLTVTPISTNINFQQLALLCKGNYAIHNFNT